MPNPNKKSSKRRIKKRKNKTVKRGGKNTVAMIGDEMKELASSATKNVTDAGLKLVGLERINKPKETNPFITNIENRTDKIGSMVLNDVNEVLASEAVESRTKMAAKDTAELLRKGAETFNRALDDPLVKEEVTRAIKHAGEIGSVLVDASKEPINKAIENTAETIEKSAPKLGAAIAKTGWDIAGSIPPVSIVVDGMNILYDVAKATSAASDVVSEAITSGSELFLETKENLKQKMREFEEKKKMAQTISNRTTNSINQFENPTKHFTSKFNSTDRKRF